MPVPIILYQEHDGTSSLVEFFAAESERVRVQARHRIQLLAEHGHQLRRPHADYLEDGIYELRWRTGTVQYRILYFFHKRTAVVLAHAMTKKRTIPPSDLARAKQRKDNFYANPTTHTHLGGFPNG